MFRIYHYMYSWIVNNVFAIMLSTIIRLLTQIVAEERMARKGMGFGADIGGLPCVILLISNGVIHRWVCGVSL